MMYRLAGVLLLMAIGSAAFAEEAIKNRLEFCARDSAACRNLALEVAKADVRDAINEAQRLVPAGSFLCPEDNPQCCPPQLQPVCATFRDEVVAAARVQLQQSAKSESCTFAEGICDILAGKFCTSIGESYTPWSGCTAIGGGVVEPSCPPGTVPGPLGGNCQPWPPCPIGQKHNSKGHCKPEPCFHRITGTPVPCNFYPGNDGIVTNRTIPTDNKAPARYLVEHLSDKSLRLEAAKQVLEDLKASTKYVEDQVNQLSQ